MKLRVGSLKQPILRDRNGHEGNTCAAGKVNTWLRRLHTSPISPATLAAQSASLHTRPLGFSFTKPNAGSLQIECSGLEKIWQCAGLMALSSALEAWNPVSPPGRIRMVSPSCWVSGLRTIHWPRLCCYPVSVSLPKPVVLLFMSAVGKHSSFVPNCPMKIGSWAIRPWVAPHGFFLPWGDR